MKLNKLTNKKNIYKSYKKKILIISQLKNKNNLLKPTAIYLNEGCLSGDLIKNNLNKKLLPNYPHLKNKEVYKNYFYLLGIYEIFLKIISLKLNKIHNVNYSKKYWRIVIGYWLFEFISIVFDNWKRLKYINSYYNLNYIEVAKFKNSEISFRDHSDFSQKINTDVFNNIIYSDLLQFFKSAKIKYFFVKKKYFNKNISYKSILNILINNILKILIIINSFFVKNSDAVIHDSYLSKKILFLLQIRFKQIPQFYISPNINTVSLNKRMRFQIVNCSNDTFTKIVSKLLFKYMPSSYLENYHNYLRRVNNINWPKNPKFIFSSSSFSYDDFFKLWLAGKKENFKTKVITGQHGGFFFTTQFSFFQKHQSDISDLILTWGRNKKKYRSVFNFKTNNKKIKYKKNGNLLFVHYSLSRFSGIHSTYAGFSYLKYLKDQFNLIKKLDRNILNNLVFREYPVDLGWNIDLKTALKINLKLDVLIDKNQKLYNSLTKSRICLVNLNGTIFLEVMNLNFPTIVFLNNNNEPLNKETKKYLNILKKVGVYFDNYEMAAKKINEVWDDVDGWWYSNSVQNAVNIFCNKFSKRSKKNTVNKLLYSIIN
jgi:putative transferase (TIGR04331 family)